ncbi:MAG: BamA/TamA family outer membrane protein [Myxococcaceae bacterium]|nr:BamA/TamA family outer membrane protein [Myxococcaceae bacterium]
MTVLLALLALGAADKDSEYEKTLIAWGLEQHAVERIADPTGLVVEGVLTAREDVFSDSDPLTWPRIFHARTRENVILREVLPLLKPGDTWSQVKVAEIERNLRALIIIAVAKVVPVRGPNGGVIALVVTKDRWSFRANFSYSLVGSVLEYLHVPITEMNLLGQAIEVTVDPELRRDTFILGQEIIWRRIADSRVLVRESLGIVLNRNTAKPEGTYGILQVALPLITLDQPWGFNVFATWDLRRVRIFRGSRIWELGYPDDDLPSQAVPYVYDRRVLEVAALGTRRFVMGEWRADVTAGPGGYMRQYRAPSEPPLQPDVDQWFTSTWLPRSEDAVYLYASATLFRARYEKRHDIETYGLTEDFQSGLRLIAAVKYAPPLTANHFVELGATVRYRWFLGDDILTVWGAAASRFFADGRNVNQHYGFQVANWSPQFEGGRFVTRIRGDFRRNDLNNFRYVLGAGEGLRGTASGALAGRNMLLGNFEYRTRPFNLLTTLVGLVLFYDVGTAYDVNPQLTHSVGLGLRVLIPQLNTQVIRLDLGFIVNAPQGGFSADRISSTFGNVTQLQSDFLDDPL